jgi:hypothetical protein
MHLMFLCIPLTYHFRQSTFAAALQQHFPQFQRCNQDDLGDRRQVENLARATLSDGHSVCIDRTNFNPVYVAHPLFEIHWPVLP